MATAKKLASGNWRVLAFSYAEIITDANGKQKKKNHYKSFTSPNKKEAEFMAAQFMHNRDQRRHVSGRMFKGALDSYIASKSNILSPSTIRGYRIMQHNAFPMLLDRTLKELSETDIVQRQINENAQKYSVKSLKNQVGLISAVLKVNKLTMDSVTLPVDEKKEIPVPTKTEIEKIMKIIGQEPEIECQVLLALTCSLRQSEIAALTPSKIDGSTVRVAGSMVPDSNHHLVYKSANKTKNSMRSVRMPDYLAAKIADLCKDKGPNDFIFTISPNGLLSRFKKLLEANGMYPYTIHSLRHAFASLMHNNGVPDKYIMAMGGWSSDYVMKKVYMYTFEEETDRAKEKMNNYFDEVLTKK